MIEAVYIWLDIDGKIRNKSRYLLDGADIPNWSFDGSSTGQANTEASDITLVPVAHRSDVQGDINLVFCEMLDNGIRIKSDYRPLATKALRNSDYGGWLFGFEQEFVLKRKDNGRPLGWPKVGFPAAQGEYYCSTNSGANIIAQHAIYCLDFGLSYFGNNAEVMPGQWEYQIGPRDSREYNLYNGIDYCDDLIFSRFLLQGVADEFDCYVDYSPKPVEGDWNGSGLHTNFSTKIMRADKEYSSILNHLELNHHAYLKHVCGKDWETRLTGKLETSDPTKFSVGVADRSCSIRIPPSGEYLEDRRPCANANPYKIVAAIVI